MNLIRNIFFGDYTFKITTTAPRGQRVSSVTSPSCEITDTVLMTVEQLPQMRYVYDPPNESKSY